MDNRRRKPANRAPLVRKAVPDSRGADSQKLHKVLAQAGMGSRRLMEEWIREGRVIVNGVTATIGTRVSGQERITVDGRPLRLAAAGAPVRILLYHKPEGEIVTREDPGGRDTVFSHLPRLRGAKWLAVGRLDVNTSGLLIFTTSGDLANRMMHPRFDVEREYAVRIFGKLSDEQLHQLQEGIALADGLARCERVTDAGGEGSNHWYRLVVKEGRNRLVRRVFEALGYTVSRLIRVRFGVVELPSRLRRGQSVELSAAEIARLADWLAQSGPAGVVKSPRAPARTRNHRRRLSAAR